MRKSIFLVILIIIFPMFAKATSYPIDITTATILELQEAVELNIMTYEDIVRAYLERIEAYNDDFNAVITINNKALEEARQKDLERKDKKTSSFYGIPFIVKDNIDVLGFPTTVGSKELSDSYPKEDAEVIKILKNKGAIVLGKANMSKFAFYASSSKSDYGEVSNPYKLGYSSYGSSGGSAVSVSLKFAPFALGTDTNSSLRAPASASGVVGFRPTTTLISTSGVVPYDITKDTVGPLTNTVIESAMILGLLAYQDETKYIKRIENATLKGKKIGVIEDFLYGKENSFYGVGKTDDEIIVLMEDKIKKIKEAGAEIFFIKDFYKEKYKSLDDATLGGWTFCHGFNKYIKNTNSKIKSFFDMKDSSLKSYYYGCNLDIDIVDTYDEKKKDYASYVEDIFNYYDLDAIIYPTTKNTMIKNNNEIEFESSSYTISPQLGYPSCSVLLGYDSNGFSYGIEWVTLKYKEELLYELLYAYEQIKDPFKLSFLAPPLYEVKDEVIALKYMKKLNLDLSLEKELNNFFENYNIKNDASLLLNKIIYFEGKSFNYENYIFIFLSIILILIVLVIRKKSKKKIYHI